MNLFSALANKGIQSLPPYQAGKPIEAVKREYGIQDVIKLASNENPWGPSPKAIAAIKAASTDWHLYPDGEGFLLKQKLVEHLNITPQQLILGNGSDNILDIMVEVFVKPDAEVISSEFAFANFLINTKSHCAQPVIVKAKNWGHDLEAMANAVTPNTQLIFIANPNNPTGTWCAHNQVKTLLETIPTHVWVVLDEAYYEFSTHEPDYPDALTLQLKHPNLVITRTFSKIYGLAGLRLGYGIAHPDIINLLNRVRLPFNVNTIAMIAGIAALDDEEHLQKTLENNRIQREIMIKALTQLGLPIISSTVTNFITVDCQQPAAPIYEKLLELGIIVRPLLPYSMPQHLRVSIGLPEENQRFLQAMALICNT